MANRPQDMSLDELAQEMNKREDSLDHLTAKAEITRRQTAAQLDATRAIISNAKTCSHLSPSRRWRQPRRLILHFQVHSPTSRERTTRQTRPLLLLIAGGCLMALTTITCVQRDPVDACH